MVSALKFLIKEVEGLCYLCCENKGPNQLQESCAADSRLCFCIFKHQSGFLLALFKGIFNCCYPFWYVVPQTLLLSWLSKYTVKFPKFLET